MKILIIGAKGMLGQALAKEFADFKPALWDKEEIDITDAQISKQKIQNLRPDVIINCAAYNDVDGCEDNPQLANSVNGEAVKNLAVAANMLDATLVHYSTAYVFDGNNPQGYKESDLPNPLSVYGKSKLVGERGAAGAKAHYILRLDRLFSEAGQGKKSFVDKILEAALAQKELKIIDEEEGSPTYAPDLAKMTRLILQQKPPFGIYHAANFGSCTWYGLAVAVFQFSGIGVELLPVAASAFKRKAQRPKCSVLINTKLPNMRSWQEALSEYLTGGNL